MTNVPKLEAYKVPMGQLLNLRQYPSGTYRGVTAPNADTLYSIAWIDLDKEPWIFSHPDMENRLYLFPMHGLWMPIFESLGKRTTGSAAALYVLTGPKWKGTLPSNLQQRVTKQIYSPTRYMLILGRTYCTGTKEDYAIVHKLQDQYILRPLSAFINNENKTVDTYIPLVPSVNPNPGFSMTDDVRTVINNMNISTYFNMMTTLMKDNPPFKEDRFIIRKMALIGLVPGQTFDSTKLKSNVKVALNDVPKIAFNRINVSQTKIGTIQNGWVVPEMDNNFGTNYLRRAVIAAFGWPGNLPENANYPYTSVDSDGKKLSGQNKYVIHFAKGQTPPVDGFWSITMYDSEYFFVPNSLNKFTVSPRDKLVYNDDGSLDLYFQHTPPEMNKQANWLPAPQGDFILMLRMYLPKITNSSSNDESWIVPPVKKLL